MLRIVWLLGFSLFLLACQKKQKEKSPALKSLEQKSEPVPSQKVLKEKTKTLPKPATANPKSKAKKAAPTSIQKEIDQRKNDIQRILRTSLSQTKPGLDIHEVNEWHQARLAQFNALSCSETFPNSLPKFDLALRKNYPESYENTGKADGQSFCWYQHPDLDQVRIVYTRNEGGHASDVLSLRTVEKTTQTIYGLPLVSWYGREAYECTIESEWLPEQKIRRTIVERLAWRAADDPDGSLQPRSETVQVFQVLANGKVEMESEDIVNYNFEEWLGEKD